MVYRSEKYKEFIRDHRCCMCGDPESECHHEPMGQAGMGIKAPDSHCVPLCRSCHTLHDQIGTKTFWKNNDIKGTIIKYLTEYISGIERK